jgi:hypothetical protein
MPITIIAKNVRLSFDKNLFDPTESKGKKPGKRTVNAICSDLTTFLKLQDGKKIAFKQDDFDEIIKDALKQKFAGKAPAKFENWAVRKNTEANNQQSGERFKGYEDDNGIYFSPSRYADQGYPAFVRKDGSVINMATEDGVAEARRRFYGGCYVAIKLNIAAFQVKEDNVTKNGVTAYLEALQFLSDGERFGGGDASADGFESEGSDEEDDLV